MTNDKTVQFLVPVLLAVFGGIARLLSQKGNSEKRLANVISSCLIASFLGVMAFFAAGYFELRPNIAYMLAGLSGWVGPRIIDVFTNIIINKFGFGPEFRSSDESAAHGENDMKTPQKPDDTDPDA